MNPLFLAFKGLTMKTKLIAFGVLALILVVTHGSAYMIGKTKGKAISAVEIAKYEEKVQALQAEKTKLQIQINDRVTVRYRDRVQTITNTEYKNRDVIENVITPRDTNVSMGWIYAHNQSATGEVIDINRAANNNESNVDDAKVLSTINSNYSIAQQCAAQVKGWNEWYTETAKLYDSYVAQKKGEKK